MIYTINMYTTVCQFWRFVFHHEQSVIDHYARISLLSFCTKIRLHIYHLSWPSPQILYLSINAWNIICVYLAVNLLEKARWNGWTKRIFFWSVISLSVRLSDRPFVRPSDLPFTPSSSPLFLSPIPNFYRAHHLKNPLKLPIDLWRIDSKMLHSKMEKKMLKCHLLFKQLI